MKKEIGGQRIGSGNKMDVELHGYQRSTHNMSKVIRTTMSPGTLVPIYTEIGLNGDTMEIDIESKIKTMPTNGPLFGSFKTQIDVFVAPMRLYVGALHMNKLGIGLKMQNIKFPFLKLEAKQLDWNKPLTGQQINPSCILAYLGERGLGTPIEDSGSTPTMKYRNIFAIPLLAYWEIYGNYYANKQEEIGMYVAGATSAKATAMTLGSNPYNNQETIAWAVGTKLTITGTRLDDEYTLIKASNAIGNYKDYKVSEINKGNSGLKVLTATGTLIEIENTMYKRNLAHVDFEINQENPKISLDSFPLENINKMRERILGSSSGAFDVIATKIFPYYQFTTPYGQGKDLRYAKELPQNGLGIKTYNSDQFNNWLATEWIDGTTGINKISAVDTSGGSFNIDTLNLATKVYNMLNRIAVSGGSYDDWQEAVYGENAVRRAESPIYVGGYSSEIGFSEVTSTAETVSVDDKENPLGTLGGRGAQYKENGGKIIIKIKEPSIVMAIMSITPRVDYSQGNKWFTSLENMDQLHKPALDGIGFQELITEKMAWWDTFIDEKNVTTKLSAGKQPAWLDYMTTVNECYGKFARENDQMFMTLNRRYTPVKKTTHITKGIADLTTYIDPTKYNYAFAQKDFNGENFWVQVAINNKMRRIMSAKVMPNL